MIYSIIEKFPIFDQSTTASVDIKNGLNDIIKNCYGNEAGIKMSKACEEINALRETCCTLINDRFAKISDLEASILKYCFYIECFKATLIKDVDYSQYFVFQWTEIISNNPFFDHDLKFDQYSFLFIFVYKSLIDVNYLRRSSEDFKEHIRRLELCESILVLIQTNCSESKCINFFPGVISVMLGLCELYKHHITVELLYFNQGPPSEFVSLYCNQMLVCDNILSDLETSLIEFQQIFEDFITVKKRISEIYAYLSYADTFDENNILESIACVAKADKILRSVSDLYRNKYGPFKDFMPKFRQDVENKKNFFNSKPNIPTKKLTSDPYLPPAKFKTMPTTFSFLGMNHANPFSDLNHHNNEFPEYELKCKQAIVILFNRLLERAKKDTNDYYAKISAFNFNEVFTPTDVPIPGELISGSNITPGVIAKDMEDLNNQFTRLSTIVEKHKPNIPCLSLIEETKNFNENYLKNFSEMSELFNQITQKYSSSLQDINHFEAKMCSSSDMLPSVFRFKMDSFNNTVLEIKKLLVKGDTMIQQRDRLITEIKDIVSKYDFSKEFKVKNIDITPEKSVEEGFRNILQVKTIEANLTAQETIINHLITRNSTIFDARAALSKINESRSAEIAKLIETKKNIADIKKMIEKVKDFSTKEEKFLLYVDFRDKTNLLPKIANDQNPIENSPIQPLITTQHSNVFGIPQPTIHPNAYQPIQNSFQNIQKPKIVSTFDPNRERILFLVNCLNQKYSEIGTITKELSFLLQQPDMSHCTNTQFPPNVNATYQSSNPLQIQNGNYPPISGQNRFEHSSGIPDQSSFNSNLIDMNSSPTYQQIQKNQNNNFNGFPF